MSSLFRGFAFPFRLSGSELPAPATDEQLIHDSVEQIVMTSRGERLMRPSFGSGALGYVFENNSIVLEENLRTDVLTALTTYEPRIIVTAINAIRKDNTITLDVIYVIRATRQQQRLQVPLGTV